MRVLPLRPVALLLLPLLPAPSVCLSQPSRSGWKPSIESLADRVALRQREVRTETIGSLGFHHVEFYCGDARTTAHHFCASLGLSVTGTTGQATGNDKCVSYGLESGSNGEALRILLTAPYSLATASPASDDPWEGENEDDDAYDAPRPLPGFDAASAHSFFRTHGLAVRAVGLEVADAGAAFRASVQRGAIPVLEPTVVRACRAQRQAKGDGKSQAEGPSREMAEVELYGDVVLRFVGPTGAGGAVAPSGEMPFLPHLAPTGDGDGNGNPSEGFGIYRIDHAVGNVPDLEEAHERIKAFTGFHEFAEFCPEDVGTVDSGLNSVVLASDSEEVLLPLNEPTEGRRKSQIQTYLEQNEGAGLQHLALKTRDIFSTIRKMRQSEKDVFGFELMKRPSDEYYRELPDRLGDQLTQDQYEQLEELGILADSDEEGILLQVFTKPIGDRPTFFFEIIQRIGCVVSQQNGSDSEHEAAGRGTPIERPGCGGFGQGNFRELFKSIEDHEKTLKV
ncbi:unnamed protein product [Pseudo-nitzschia multistriata]|uniref:4-hydroxyphenylpyruvate dioxygenase n=1 Tax=Pseudo-nitzschia multistriata TaxID=183589 RepID=A0A448ZEJ3_9STRA|nr:unnamed protein product [Pseudo-nitzschia multistriata]